MEPPHFRVLPPRTLPGSLSKYKRKITLLSGRGRGKVTISKYVKAGSCDHRKFSGEKNAGGGTEGWGAGGEPVCTEVVCGRAMGGARAASATGVFLFLSK